MQHGRTPLCLLLRAFRTVTVLLICFSIGQAGAAPPAPLRLRQGFWLSLISRQPFIPAPIISMSRTMSGTRSRTRESGNYTVTHASNPSQGYVCNIRGANTTNPFTVTPSVGQGPAGGGHDLTTSTAPSVTTVVNNSLVILFGQDWGIGTNILTPPVGFTPTFNMQASALRGSCLSLTA